MMARTMAVAFVSLSTMGLLPTDLEAQVVYDGRPLDYWVDQIEAGKYFGGAYKAFEQLACSAAPAVPRPWSQSALDPRWQRGSCSSGCSCPAPPTQSIRPAFGLE